MTESNLLKYARAKDDQEFGWRIAAAMQIKAQEIASWELEPASRALTDWVLENPMVSHERMLAWVSTRPGIAAGITITAGGAVSTGDVTDSDIQFTVNEVWDQVAASIFSTAK